MQVIKKPLPQEGAFLFFPGYSSHSRVFLEAFIPLQHQFFQAFSMDSLIQQAGFGDILDKVRNQERLSLEDGKRLFSCPDILLLGYLAG